MDISSDLIDRAKNNFPQGHFTVASATNYSKIFKYKFDVIVISMLFPSIRKIADITKVLIESKSVLKTDGIILIGLPYPCFDGYMQGGLLGRKGVSGEFKGYFEPGMEFKLEHEINGQKFTFADCHWSLGDYLGCIKESGLQVTNIDECMPEQELASIDLEFYKERLRFPTYLTIVLKLN